MGSQIIKNSGHTAYGLKEYVVDTLQELNELSVDDPQGSLATVINGGNLKYYMMNGNHEWKEVHLNNGPGNGSDATGINTLIIDAWYNESSSTHSYQYKINNSLTYDEAKQILIDSKNDVQTILEFKIEHRQGEAQSQYRKFWFYDLSNNTVGRPGKYLVSNTNEIDENTVEYRIHLDQYYYAYIQFSWDDETQTISICNDDINYVSVYPYEGLTNSALSYFRDNIELEGVSFPFCYMGVSTNSETSIEITAETILNTIVQGLSSFDADPIHYYITSIDLFSVQSTEEAADAELSKISCAIKYIGGIFPAGSVQELYDLSDTAKIQITTTDTSLAKMIIIHGMTDFNQKKNPIYMDH